MSKRRPRHPDAVHAALSQKETPPGLRDRWVPDYGWLIMLYRESAGHGRPNAPAGPTQERGWRVLPPGTTIIEARRVANDALRNDGYDKAWIIQKRD